MDRMTERNREKKGEREKAREERNISFV